jgi:hypothetical protein
MITRNRRCGERSCSHCQNDCELAHLLVPCRDSGPRALAYNISRPLWLQSGSIIVNCGFHVTSREGAGCRMPKKNRPGNAPGRSFISVAKVTSAIIIRAQVPAAEAAEAAAAPGSSPLPGSPIHPDTSASPEAAEEAVGAAEAAAEVAEAAAERNCRSGSASGCVTANAFSPSSQGRRRQTS